MPKICGIIYFLYVVVLNSGTASSTSMTDAEIKKLILKDYDKSIPPFLYSSEPFNMWAHFYLSRIRELDEKKGMLIIEGVMLMFWIDRRLFLADIPEEISNFRTVEMSKEEIWVPGLHFYNWIEKNELTLDAPPIAYKYLVYLAPRYTLKTSCSLNLRYYPFDTQVCEFILAVSGIEGDSLPANYSTPIIYQKAYMNSKNMFNNFQWTLKNQEVSEKFMNIDSDLERKVFVYQLTVKRSMPLITLGILTPCISCLLLILTTFWMPAGSTLRSGMSITSMLVSSTSLFTLGKILPVSGPSTPIIVEYVSIALILAAISSIQTMLTSIIKRCVKPPPISYSTVILKIPTMCLLLLGISIETHTVHQLDQTFLFSELDDPENGNIPEIDINVRNVASPKQPHTVQSLWLKYTILFDRIMFYVLGLIVVLFIVSVIITE